MALEKEMLQYDVKATVLKAGHHGSNTSSSEEFIQAVKPEVTILSYGEDNKYGHPHAEIVDRLQAIGSKIYATADLGTITVSTDGVNYTVNGKETFSVETGNILSKEEPTTAIEIVSKDLVTEIVGIKNSGQHAVSLKDWRLISIEGHQVYNFPNLSLQPGKRFILLVEPMHGKGKII